MTFIYRANKFVKSFEDLVLEFDISGIEESRPIQLPYEGSVN